MTRDQKSSAGSSVNRESQMQFSSLGWVKNEILQEALHFVSHVTQLLAQVVSAEKCRAVGLFVFFGAVSCKSAVSPGQQKPTS